MADTNECIANLLPEKRTLLEKGLAQSFAAKDRPVPLLHSGAGVPVPSFGQELLWLLEQNESGTARYNNCFALHLNGDVKLAALKNAWGAVVDRHETLRTRYINADGRLQIDFSAAPEVPIPVTDFSGIEHNKREDLLSAALHAEANRPIDLGRDPVIRTVLYRLGECEHVLQVTIHDVAFDGWSTGVLFRDFAAFYNAAVTGTAAQLPELPFAYSDYARWQREQCTGPEKERLVSYWKNHLQGSSFTLQLPTDRPRPALQTFRGAVRGYSVPAPFATAIKELCMREQVTPFMVALAALYALLARYSGRADILIGSPIAARSRIETEDLVGFFTNTVILRGDLNGDPTFRELLQRVRQTTLGAYAHQDLPLELLIDQINPELDRSRSALFQVMLVFQSAPTQISELHGLESSVREVGTETSKFDFTIELRPSGEALEATIEYNTDLFDADTIDRLWGHLTSYLQNASAAPEQKAAAISLLTSAERQQLLVDWNNTAAEFPGKGLCLHQLIENQAARTPDQVALVFERQKLTYGELNHRANQLAHHLQGLAVGPDTLVGLFMERSLEMIVGLLGILKAGGAYVPMDPAYPKERLAFILEDSKAPIVLTQKSLMDKLPNFSGQTVCLDSGWAQITNQPQENPVSLVKPENLAYTLFTSGSTGRPKGVALEHRSAVAFIHWANRVFTPKQLEGVLFSTSICFDLSVFELFVPLSAGSKVVIVPNVLHLPNLSAKDGITLINTVPSAMAELLRMGYVPQSVKTINLAGEALSGSLVDQIYALTNVDYVYNLYGPTETTTYSTYMLVPSGCPVTIGKPIANTQAYILDPNRNLVPIGVTGELYLAGAGLARGYYGRSDLTNERFVPNPFSGQRDARMYRTGDLCNWLSDGNIRYVGRADHQVKLRGFRIELGEIEAILEQQPGVEKAVVVACEDRQADKILVAYFVAKTRQSAHPDSLRGALEAALPGYMVPSHFVQLESLPLTANGKIDRNALPPVSLPNDISAGAGEEPRGEFEQLLAKAWAEALGLKRICRQDNFFHLGGHSLAALKIAFKSQQEFNVHFPLQMFVRYPVLSEQAKRLEQMVVEQMDASVLESLVAEVIQNRERSLGGQVETNPVNRSQIEVNEAREPTK